MFPARFEFHDVDQRPGFKILFSPALVQACSMACSEVRSVKHAD